MVQDGVVQHHYARRLRGARVNLAMELVVAQVVEGERRACRVRLHRAVRAQGLSSAAE